MASNQQPVVAELGRPETAAETAARKAKTSAEHRQHQTARNLIYALIVTVGVAIAAVVFTPSMMPAGTKSPTEVNVDYTAIAKQGAGIEPDPLIAPKLPKTWTSNSAQLNQKTNDGVDDWYIGLITPDKQYIGLAQGFDANDTWLATQVANTNATGSTTISGIHWKIYNNRNSSNNVGNAKYALSTVQGKSTVVLYGTANNAEFTALAKSVAVELDRDAEGH